MNAKRLCAVLAIAGLVLLGGNAFAEIGTIDQVPAATLLLPYFEVDLDAADSTSGLNTYFSVNNASAAATIAHVVIWSDYTVPVIDFNIYLTGYDVQTVNLYDIIGNGTLPTTADAPRDPDVDGPGGISPNGAPYPAPLTEAVAGDSDPVAGFPNCTDRLPITNVPGILLDRLQDGLTGNPTAFDAGECLGFDHGDNVARGYITIDDVNQCSLEFPGDAGYFTTVATTENQLWGDYFIVDAPNNFAIGESMVHIEAELGLGAGAANTFYKRYTAAQEDDREALGSYFGTRYLAENPVFTGGTDLLVWRDSGVEVESFPCATGPGEPFPLNEVQVVAFDEQEQWTEICTGTQFPVSPPLPGDPPCFPLETQRVTVGEGDFDPPYDFGWMFLDLDVPGNSTQEQAWVVTNISALGAYSVGYDALQLNNLTFANSGTETR